MAHKVQITQFPEAEIQRKDIVLSISEDGEKIGEIHISKGSIDFWPAGNPVNYRRATWSRFADIMREHGAPKRAKKAK